MILFWLPINIWAAPNHELAWQAAGTLCVGITLCVALYSWSPEWLSPTHLPQVLSAGISGFGTLLALVSLPFINWKPEYRLFYAPIYQYLDAIARGGESIHANVLAGGLAISIPLLTAIFVSPRLLLPTQAVSSGLLRRLRIIYGLALAIQSVILILLQSRGADLAVATGLLVVISLRWRRLFMPLIFLCLGLTLIALFFRGNQLLEAMSNDGALGGWSGRLRVWQGGLSALHDFPFTGIGIGNYTVIMPLLYPTGVNVEGYPHAHNHLLQIGLDLGIPGFTAYLAILILIMALTVGIIRNQKVVPLSTKSLAIGALGSMVAFLTHGIFDATLWGTRLAPLPWVLFALVVTLAKLETADA
ncbi:MAG: O-antigen ligase family protein [Caldilineaceae bacterium]|nr:O-antigen ligase family protein [Caldilineaceae bacterium]